MHRCSHQDTTSAHQTSHTCSLSAARSQPAPHPTATRSLASSPPANDGHHQTHTTTQPGRWVLRATSDLFEDEPEFADLEGFAPVSPFHGETALEHHIREKMRDGLECLKGRGADIDRAPRPGPPYISDSSTTHLSTRETSGK